jgi:hypothetical protein
MKMKELRWLFLVVMAGHLIVSFKSEPVTLGISAQSTNDGYYFAGGTQPAFLTLAVTLFALYLLLMYAPPANLGNPLPGVLRRFVAFWLDFFLAMMVIGPVIGILPTITEWRRTGQFEWYFERTTHAPGDGWLAATGSIVGFVALVFYYAFPLMRCRPSPGSCVAGYQIVPDDGVTMNGRTALLRTLLGFFAASAAYLAPFVARDRKKGKFWLDKVFGTKALKLK